ncbi:MAG: haloalkane dehalogenase [Mycobacterium sp.]|nr:haloalkane dehalogenase [Mycobacterium sp.]
MPDGSACGGAALDAVARIHHDPHLAFALWGALDLGGHVTLVLHDWGSVLGFDWANQHRHRVPPDVVVATATCRSRASRPTSRRWSMTTAAGWPRPMCPSYSSMPDRGPSSTAASARSSGRT